MIQNLVTGEIYGNRREAKNKLGGLGAYNELMKRGGLQFLNGSSLTFNNLIQKLSYEKRNQQPTATLGNAISGRLATQRNVKAIGTAQIPGMPDLK